MLTNKAWKQISIHACIVGGSAALTALASAFGQADPGTWSAVAVALLSTLAKYLQKLSEGDDPPGRLHALAVKRQATWSEAARED